MDSGPWTVDSGQRFSGKWTVDSGHYSRQRAVDRWILSGQWDPEKTLDSLAESSGQWTVDSPDSGQWTVDSGQRAVDSG